MSPFAFRTTLAGLSLAMLAALSACNGGGSDTTSTAGVGSGGTGYASGTVTGFGSVVVDGVTIDDRSAAVDVEVSPGVTGDGDVLLGQRVEVETDKDGLAKHIHIMAEVMGPVQSVDSVNLKLVVAGQTVYANTDADKGPVTVYGGGYSSFADIAINHLVEVHAIPKLDVATGKPLLQATRIEKKSTLAFVRVSSVVSDLSTSSKTFTLGTLTVDYSNANVVPASRQIANGQRVVVFGPSINSGTLAATLVRIAEPKAQGVAAQVGGVVSNYNSSALTFEVNGVTINAKNALIVPANRSIANGSYVRVKGSYADSGELVASQVQIRKKNDDDMLHEVSLKGSVANYTSLSGFTVRGVPVDAHTATLVGCGAGLSNEMYVEVEGNISATGILASKVSCKSEPAAAELELRGSVGSLDLINRTFVLTASTRVVTVSWTDLTSLRGVVLATLSGRNIEVEGYLQGNGVLVARKVSLQG